MIQSGCLKQSLFVEQAGLVGTKTRGADIVEIENSDRKSQFSWFGKISLAQTLEFAMMTLWTLQVESSLSDFRLLLPNDVIATTNPGALENVRLTRETRPLRPATSPMRWL